MKDYLTTLAARSLNLAPVATPRLMSWFEPTRVAGGTTVLPARPLLEPTQDSPQRVATAPVDGSVAAERDTAPQATPPAADPFLQEHGAGDPVADRPRAQGIRVTPDPGAQALPASDPAAAAQAGQSPAPAPPAETSGSRLSPALPSVREPEARSAAGKDLRAPQAPRLDDIVRRLTDDRLTAFERARAREGVRPQPAAGARVHAARQEPPPAARERPAATGAVRLAREAPGVEPQAAPVRITIGRIEVHAVMPAPPPSIPKPVTPSNSGAVSLDEYLKQRSGAGR